MRNGCFSIVGARSGLLRALTFSFAMALCGLSHGGAVITTLDRDLPAEYEPLVPVDVTITINIQTNGTVGAVGLEEVVPEGWGFAGVQSGITPAVVPSIGKDGLLEFAWFPNPPLPEFSFTYRLDVAASSVGTKAFSGQAIMQVDQEPEESPVVGSSVVRSGSGTPHDADSDDSFVVGLTELLRVIQFFAIGSYSCPANPGFSEDGFFAGDIGDQLCDPHDSDFDGSADYVISLSELLRIVQLYNAGTYYECVGEGEDDFCAGPPPVE